MAERNILKYKEGEKHIIQPIVLDEEVSKETGMHL